jgi:hypothetical protein
MADVAEAVDVVVADFAGYRDQVGQLRGGDLESFERLAGLYGMKDGVEGVLKRLYGIEGRICERLGALAPLVGSGEDHGPEVLDLMAQMNVLDSLWEQLDRYVDIGIKRNAGETSGDLLPKLQAWIKLMRGWLAGINRQLSLIEGRS